MKKESFPSAYIEDKESVYFSAQDDADVRRIENDPEKILRLVDLMFLMWDGKDIPS